MLKIRNLKLSSPIMQSPMAGCTDLAFRILAREHGLELAMTEMISAEALVRNHKKTYGLLIRSPEDQPTGCQIVGFKPESMAEAAKILASLGFELIDINCGCPVRKITGQEAGAALLKDPKKAEKIIRGVVIAAGKTPVTVKMRSGYSDSSGKEALRLAKIAQDNGISALIIHGRTKIQGYSGHADWQIIEKIKQKTNVPVFGNGDIFRPEDAVRMKKETGCDGIAIGRGALGNPWLYGNIRAAFKRKKMHTPIFQEIRKTALRHICLTATWEGEKLAHLKGRHIACWYFKGCPGASRLRAKINHSRSLSELTDEIEAFQPAR